MKEKAKTYRVAPDLAKQASEKMIRYITENKVAVTEAQIINASIKKGLEDLTDAEIQEFIKESD